jgi:glycosyltransferase involved in cell wall biosynthesis
MRLLHILSSVDPRGGGPMEALRHYGHQVQSMGHDLRVLTLDDPQAPHVAEYPLPVKAIGPSRGKYAYNPHLTGWLREHARDFTAVIVHGLWQYHGFGAWRALHASPVPYFVFTHGMLDPWFKSTYPLKHVKKQLYWPWAEYRLLRDARAVLFTSEEERRQARQSFSLYRAREAVVDYGTCAPPNDSEHLRELFISAYPKLRGKRLLVFLGRIHPKKGCDLLIEAFSRIAASDHLLHLVVAGPDQTGWEPQLRALALRAGIGDRVDFPGMLRGDLKWGALYAGDAFVLPSHQENFGIAVAEALGCGLPVLISDKVNIWREIEADRAGIVAPNTADGTERSLRRWLALPEAERAQMRLRSRETFERRFTAAAMARSLIGVIQGPTAR